MKKIFLLIILSFFINNYSLGNENCSSYKKLSKEYLKCTKDNLKYKSDEVGITKKLKKFKESKTLKEFFY